jgi:hypothetical protein
MVSPINPEVTKKLAKGTMLRFLLEDYINDIEEDYDFLNNDSINAEAVRDKLKSMLKYVEEMKI